MPLAWGMCSIELWFQRWLARIINTGNLRILCMSNSPTHQKHVIVQQTIGRNCMEELVNFLKDGKKLILGHTVL